MILDRLVSRNRWLAVAALAAVALTACSSASAPTDATVPAPIAPAAVVVPDKPVPIPAPPQLPARGYLLLDHMTGQVLAAANEDSRLEPASLTKLMSAYVVFHTLQDGRIKLDDPVTISRHARQQEGSRMFVDVGTQVSVEALLQGMIVQSGNDATVALAEHVAGSEPLFVDLMNQYARQLGMTSSNFQNSPGMPGPEHYTTAADMGRLARALIAEFPAHYKWYSQREFTWNNITQPNRNGLLRRDASVDGLKTGHTRSAGYCLVSSAMREDMRVIAVVMGSPNSRTREEASAALIDYGFRFYETRKLFDRGAAVFTARLWKGAANHASLGLTQDVYATVPRGQAAALSAAIDLPNRLFAPLSTAQAVGRLRIMHGEEQIGSHEVYPREDVAQAGMFGRMADSMKLWVN